jgi:hypothetical protein
LPVLAHALFWHSGGNEAGEYNVYKHLSQIFTCKRGGGMLKVIHNKHAL